MNEIEAIVCDMDGCVVKYPNEPWHSSWDALRGCLSEADRKVWDNARDAYYGRKDSYTKWCKEYAKPLRGISVEQAEKVLFPVPYSRGVKEFFSNLNGILKDVKKGILSGGINIVADKIVEELNFDFALSNDLKVRNGYFTGEIDVKVDLYRKAELFFDWITEHNIHPDRVCYVGDSDTDRGCLGLAGIPVVINPKENLEEYARTKEIPIIHDFRQLSEIFGLK